MHIEHRMDSITVEKYLTVIQQDSVNYFNISDKK